MEVICRTGTAGACLTRPGSANGPTSEGPSGSDCVRELFVIGIGAGDPEQVTVQAIAALNRVDVFFVADKGADKDDLVALRSEICRRYITEKPYRIVEVPDPERDRTDRVADTSGYQLAVDDWHERRTAKYEQIMLAELGPGENPGFLVWGDPALYDSTIRIVERLRARGALDFDYQVIPAISSVQALAAAHRMVLNRDRASPFHITTGRRLQDGGMPPGLGQRGGDARRGSGLPHLHRARTGNLLGCLPRHARPTPGRRPAARGHRPDRRGCGPRPGPGRAGSWTPTWCADRCRSRLRPERQAPRRGRRGVAGARSR